MYTVAEALAQDGPLKDAVEGFHARPQQQALAAEIERTLDEGGVLICEAGTGTGKTFAYLVAAVLSGRRVIVSTGTKNLQEQLFHRDLPRVRDALAVPLDSALLKGRANYLCLQRLDVHAAAAGHLDPAVSADLARIRAWAGHTKEGDIAELAEVPEGAAAWRLATSTTDNCLGGECPRFDDCHVLKARRAAQNAELVVVNHHLLFADLAIREAGFGELLPGADAIIVDEAHQLPELATRFFGVSLGSGQLGELARDARSAYEAEAGDVPDFPPLTGALEASVRVLTDALAGGAARLSWDQARQRQAVVDAVAGLERALAALGDALELAVKLDELSGASSEESVRWLEIGAHGLRWHASPLDVAAPFSQWTREQGGAWILTSATLAVGGHIAPFAERLGLDDARMRVWESPFDFERQALMYLPPGLPQPRDEGYVSAVVAAMVPVLRASEGRAFVLFTSHKALRRASRELEALIDYPLLVQGSAPRDDLLRRFRTTPRAVLLGTASFWEGVDVRGEALSCVIIDKLPFAPPDDPVNEARARAMKAAGRDPFMEYQLPQAVIALKQGVGRLIRDADDRGVVVLCDPRLITRAYGRIFIESLPRMPICRDIEEVVDFFTGS
ncbi:MAG: ATP-dependent DNA helicase [Gammaproteobacteria bacterium]|nr:ATP-dependent DNA helicase [Gammaproteobacteria bacterium]NIR24474.1 ATP-dependent DNA helicase [Gammaproteobacteria bacterium]NIS06148.1 ATP-dependent DNA helicase [Gammaproteobacteria bacterium]NIU41490.1 ATP-dependent DNA helicase [Gammaproteobacteria bacterium]NIV49210.1 ATP-dependent DNA helicase [Gammaproteobacteria bacterium]